MDIRLDGKVAVVTGASSGIGAAVARAYADSGAAVALVGRDASRLERTRSGIEAGGGTTVVVETDLTAPAACSALVTDVVARLGRVDVVLHAAGVFEVVPFGVDAEQLDRQWETNVRAAYLLVHAALPHLAAGASVVLMSSIAGKVGFPSASGYCATKGAIDNLVRALAVDLGPRGIRVNALAPGNVHSPMNDALFADPAYEKAMLERTPLGRIGVTEDITAAAVLLASDAGSYITGASIPIDGGWTAA